MANARALAFKSGVTDIQWRTVKLDLAGARITKEQSFFNDKNYKIERNAM